MNVPRKHANRFWPMLSATQPEFMSAHKDIIMQPPSGNSIRRTPIRQSSRGTAMLEVALFAPMLFLLFVGAMDWGFIAYTLISLESAARTAALYTSSTSGTASDSTGACSLVLAEMRKLPNIGTGTSTCSGNPVSVTATAVTGPDGASASKVAVTYTTVSLIPIPGLLSKQMTITRTVTM